jgi:hypothetical protein
VFGVVTLNKSLKSPYGIRILLNVGKVMKQVAQRTVLLRPIPPANFLK